MMGLMLLMFLVTACVAPQAMQTSPTPRPEATPTTPASPTPTSVEPGVILTWYGQAMFTLQVVNGPTILMDPMSDRIGYQVSPLEGIDVVTVSHEHPDHNNVALATGSPKVLRGLEGDDWAQVDETIQGVRFRTVGTYHDESQGSDRGKSAIFAIEVNGLHIVHLGDLGHLLTSEQVTTIGPVDVLMIPVGGVYTIDAASATQVVDSLKPRLVVPMHYGTPRLQFDLQPVDAFLTGKTVERSAGNQVTLSLQTLPQSTTVLVLGYE
jgi:L-ascorbate metabolism protein UlaG (beta-lactamase superfamily)